MESNITLGNVYVIYNHNAMGHGISVPFCSIRSFPPKMGNVHTQSNFIINVSQFYSRNLFCLNYISFKNVLPF